MDTSIILLRKIYDEYLSMWSFNEMLPNQVTFPIPFMFFPAKGSLRMKWITA
jgi:hypothetical protein